VDPSPSDHTTLVQAKSERHNLHAGQGFFGLRPRVGLLRERFVMPPFSTWNTREGDWQDRRRLWIAKGIKSEIGRKGKLTYPMPAFMGDGRVAWRTKSQTSIFDPVVCELVYNWWCRPGGVVLDPFAGGSVRGIVASVLGLKYIGIELSNEQVEANRTQINEYTRGQYAPKWRQGDSFELLLKAPRCDFLFSCPPYGNLEIYSNEPGDISNMVYDKFLDRYRAIIAMSVDKLRDGRFACFVVGNYRSREHGRQMIDFVGDTIRAFETAGASFYNEIILINVVGSGAMRVNTTFVRGARKVVKCHQNVLVFCKGDPIRASKLIPADTGVGTGEGKIE
jgi:DNA modification methylase